MCKLTNILIIDLFFFNENQQFAVIYTIGRWEDNFMILLGVLNKEKPRHAVIYLYTGGVKIQ